MILGNGNGTFRDNGPLSSGATGTVTTLAAADVNGDGIADLMEGVGASTGSATVAVALGNGDGIFAAPTFFAVDGLPLSITTGVFTAGSDPAIISVNAAAGAVAGNGTLTGLNADVLLNNSATRAAPTIKLKAAANPTVAGVPVQLLATVSGASAAGVPTGSVQFLEGTTPLGSASIGASGKATLSTSALSAGTQSITAVYSGDGNFASATSAVLRKRSCSRPPTRPSSCLRSHS